MIPCVFTSTFLTIRNSLHVRSLECQITLTQLKPHFQTDSGALRAQSARARAEPHIYLKRWCYTSLSQEPINRLLPESQTLYFLFKVPRVRVIDNKNRGRFIDRQRKGVVCVQANVTRGDSQRRFSAQHSVAMLEQCCDHSKQRHNNVATLCCAKNRYCKSSRVTWP